MTTGDPAALSPGRLGPALMVLVRCELLKVLRNPAFMVPILALPLLLFTFFGAPNIGHTDAAGQDLGVVILVGYAAYSTMMAGLFSFGVTIAAERGSGWLTRLRVTPLSPLTLLIAKTIMALLIGSLSLTLLFSVAALSGVELSALTWINLLGRLLLGMLPFLVLGLWLGYAFAPSAAAGVANLILLPVAFASGVFVPLAQLPEFLRGVAPLLPAYHSAQFALGAVGAASSVPAAVHALWLLGYTLAFAILAGWAYARDEGQRYG